MIKMHCLHVQNYIRINMQNERTLEIILYQYSYCVLYGDNGAGWMTQSMKCLPHKQDTKVWLQKLYKNMERAVSPELGQQRKGTSKGSWTGSLNYLEHFKQGKSTLFSPLASTRMCTHPQSTPTKTEIRLYNKKQSQQNYILMVLSAALGFLVYLVVLESLDQASSSDLLNWREYNKIK